MQLTMYITLMKVSNGLGVIFADPFESNLTTAGAHMALGIIQVMLVARIFNDRPLRDTSENGDGAVEISTGT
jgi:hypothetical protein